MITDSGISVSQVTAEFLIVKVAYVPETIYGFDKVAAPSNVILSSPTVITISPPSVVAEVNSLLIIFSVEYSSKPVIKSLPSPALYSMKVSSLLLRLIVSFDLPALIVTCELLATLIKSLPSPPVIDE